MQNNFAIIVAHTHTHTHTHKYLPLPVVFQHIYPLVEFGI